MEQIIEFFKGLFDYDRWPPRWHCGYWSEFHGWLYIISEFLIWLSYFLIPFIIIRYFVKKKTTIRFRSVYLLFAAFILLCGATHFIDGMMFWIPMYRLNAALRFITGLVSLATVFQLVRVLPELFQQRTNIELENEIERRKAAEQKLARANDNLRAFAYVASHDLQEPLRKINLYMSQIISENQENFSQKSHLLADKVVGSSRRMKTLISDVLALSAIQGDVSLVVVDTNIALENALEDLEVKISERNVIIKADTLPPVLGDPTYVCQLFYNLVNNAIKFNRNRPEVTITGKTANGEVQISVADNGIGMDGSSLSKIFDAFNRLNARQDYEGSGIGLATCKRILESLQGRVEVKSSLGNGTVFTFTLKAPKQSD